MPVWCARVDFFSKCMTLPTRLFFGRFCGQKCCKLNSLSSGKLPFSLNVSGVRYAGKFRLLFPAAYAIDDVETLRSGPFIKKAVLL